MGDKTIGAVWCLPLRKRDEVKLGQKSGPISFGNEAGCTFLRKPFRDFYCGRAHHPGPYKEYLHESPQILCSP